MTYFRHTLALFISYDTVLTHFDILHAQFGTVHTFFTSYDRVHTDFDIVHAHFSTVHTLLTSYDTL